MGSNGGSWTALFAFLALAILMAALGREPVRGSPVFGDRAAASIAPPAVAATYRVVSR